MSTKGPLTKEVHSYDARISNQVPPAHHPRPDHMITSLILDGQEIY